ncbi:DsbA family protein [Bosea minatitlanensis]|uniref:DsbA family protein n=1 Tax=Bosea minatitlanensis TaxID=128782 RepID=UPI0021A70AC4|nr:DsbA family protein [Bosea minatitlanensis]MCT4496136.1 DsbA family protein [Bosea minatitlanensis]
MAVPTFTGLVRSGLRPAGLTLGVWLATVAAPALAQDKAPLTPEQRKAIVDLVRETLVKNPEIIQDALVELERRNTVAQAEAQRGAVAAEKARLVDPATSIIIGNPEGDITLVEFMDYNCGYCKRAMQDVTALSKADPKLKVVLKDFPILGPDSLEASRVAIALKNQIQGPNYFDFHNKLMSVKGRINGAKAIEVAKDFGIDVERLRKDMDAPATKASIEDTVALGDRLGLTGTPAFVIGDEVVFGAVGEAALKQKLESVRRCGKTDCAG